MSIPSFRSDLVVNLVEDGTCGNDRLIAHAAWADNPNNIPDTREDNETGWGRVINCMMRDKHSSSFEHGRMTVYVEVPGVVLWQWTRQRFMACGVEDHSFNVESGRYKHLEGNFYTPPDSRPCKEPEGFKPIKPVLTDDVGCSILATEAIQRTASRCWEEYEYLLDNGVSREVARLCLPNWSLYCGAYIGGGPLTWLQFFGKRVRKDDAVKTYPQWEIEQAASKCEELFAKRWPITYSCFNENGRIPPS